MRRERYIKTAEAVKAVAAAVTVAMDALQLVTANPFERGYGMDVAIDSISDKIPSHDIQGT